MKLVEDLYMHKHGCCCYYFKAAPEDWRVCVITASGVELCLGTHSNRKQASEHYADMIVEIKRGESK